MKLRAITLPLLVGAQLAGFSLLSNAHRRSMPGNLLPQS
jgi:hypothetical protein